MMVLHGCTQQSTSLRTDGNFEPAAEAYGIVIALPQVPNGGVIAGCWDYYGTIHTRSNKHNGAIFTIVDALKEDVALDIDADQVYIAGLSSGAGQAAVSGCLAPDVFAGVGLNAGPMVGTASSEASVVAGTTAQGVSTCRTFSGTQSAHFETQLASIIYGSMDFVVAKGYGQRNADVLRTIYGDGTMLPGSPIDVTQLPGFQPMGTGTLYSDAEGPRVQQVEVTGMGHAFPAGSGDGFELNFIARRGPAWPMMLAELFSVNNRRIDPNTRPIADAGASEDAGSGMDLSVPAEDGGVTPAPDAQASVDLGAGADGGQATGPDAGAPNTADAGVHADGDAGDCDSPAPADDGGCRCIAAPEGATQLSGIALVLLLLGFVRRRARI